MRRIVWSETALDDFCELVRYIAQDNPAAARRVASAVEQAVEALGDMPTGRRGRVTGTYEKPIYGLPYLVAYALSDEAVDAETLTVLRIIHGARDWPDEEWPSQ